MARENRVYLPSPVRALYCDVITATKFKDENGVEKGEPKYGLTVELTAKDAEYVKDKLIGFAKAKWPNRQLSELQFPLKSADRVRARYDVLGAKKGWSAEKIKNKQARFTPGTFVLKMSSGKDYPPALSRFVGKEATLFGVAGVEEAKRKFYAGCWVIPSFDVKTYDGKREDDKDGLSAYVAEILWIKDGERIGGGASDPAESFNYYAGSISAESPLGLNDDIAF